MKVFNVGILIRNDLPVAVCSVKKPLEIVKRLIVLIVLVGNLFLGILDSAKISDAGFSKAYF